MIGLLYKIAKDLFISKYRRKRLELDYTNSLELQDITSTPEDELIEKELLVKYKKVLAEMSEKQRTVFLMSRMEGLKYHEIAERLDISVKAVEKRMTITLTFLKKALLQA